MIINVNGDLLKSNCDIVCHQVNCQGVMGAGIALQIKKQFPKCYKEYSEFCHNNKGNLLGKVLFVSENNKIIANLFGQNQCSRHAIMTDYDALERGIQETFEYAEKFKLTVGFPYKIGCGIAGGDWNIVSTIIEKYFKNSKVECCIYKFTD